MTSKITQQMIDEAQDRVSVAAGMGDRVYKPAKAALVALEEAYRLQELGDKADEQVAVIGDTYRHRDALKRMGLVWNQIAKAWIGTRRQIVSLPAGCRVTTYADAAMRTMDHADSAL